MSAEWSCRRPARRGAAGFAVSVLMLCMLSACATSGYRFVVWPEDGATPQASSGAGDAVDLIEHPCGAVREITVSRLPPPGRRGHIAGTESVIEFAEGGGILRRWSLPVDASLQAIDRDRLVFAYDRRRYQVDDQGRVRPGADRTSPLEAIACPPSIEAEFRASEYLLCLRMNDLSDGAPRRIAYEAACT